MQRTALISVLALFGWIALSQAAGLFGTIFTFDAIPTWYADLNKPSFSPPNWLFGPVWTTLYTLMGIAVYLVWRKRSEASKRAVKVFLLQLALNAAWTPAFFGLQNPLLGLFVIVPLLITIIWTSKLFWKESRLTGILMLPYIAWVSFASVLNFSLWYLN